MPASLASDFKLSNPHLQSGYHEALAQVADVFNAGSNGAIVMDTPMAKGGNFETEAFFNALANGGIARRDINSNSAVAGVAVTQGQNAKVKLNRRVGPVEVTLDAIRKIGSTVEAVSFGLGQQFAKGQLVDALNSAAAAAAAALTSQANLTTTFTTTITHSQVVDAMAKMGDRAQNIRAFLMHSKVYFNLMNQAIADKVVEVAGVTIATGSVATLGKPVIITDSPALLIAGSPNDYLTLGLVPGAINLQMSEDMTLVNALITGTENLTQRFQGEYAYNMGIKGFTWDITNGGINPDASALGTSTNWDLTAANLKDCAGVLLKTR